MKNISFKSGQEVKNKETLIMVLGFKLVLITYLLY